MTAPARDAGPRWRLDRGAQLVPGGARFSVWAPKRRRVDVVIESAPDRIVPLTMRRPGLFTGAIRGIRAGARYRYRLDGAGRYPDPYSRYQPEGPHGPSMVVDPAAYRWHDRRWRGVRMPGQVIYELHIGTFTPDGTFDAAILHLDRIKRLGITLVELMPIAEWPGSRNWGYDGVDLFAPSHMYGDADALRRFVDAAHARGLGVLLDVVYNHFGPDGNYLRAYSDDYFTDRHRTEWGEAINYDGPGSRESRALIVRNAAYWISEFHLDGLRLDATQTIIDTSRVHVLAELSQRARAVARRRSILLIAESDAQDERLLRPIAQGGCGLDAMWTDDFHHAVRVALTGQREAYYTDYLGTAQELLSCVQRNTLYQGQYSQWQRKSRGSAVLDYPAQAFVWYLQNHDQISNHLRARRLHALTSPGRLRAMTALLLLAPQTPLLFMGQEFGASSPFWFFIDYRPELAPLIDAGRKRFLAQFPSCAGAEAQAGIPDPSAASTFTQSTLKAAECRRRNALYRLHRDLLRIRREDPVIRAQARDRISGAVLGPQALLLRYVGASAGERLLVVNLGAMLDYRPSPEPLLAPAPGCAWRLVWSSDARSYGGPGASTPCRHDGWTFADASAVLLASIPRHHPGGAAR